MSRLLGPIMQYSYVVADVRAAIDHFARTLEVGPFFLMDHVPFKTHIYMGQPTDADISVAIAYTGGVQIELVQQHNDAPSIFKAHMDTKGEGLQHVGVIATDFDAQIKALADKGVHPVQHGEAENGTRFAYLNTDLVPGSMVELVEVNAKLAKAFSYMENQANEWSPGDAPLFGN